MNRTLAWLSLGIFLVTAAICLSPGAFHCLGTQTCGVLPGVTAIISLMGSVVLFVITLRPAHRTFLPVQSTRRTRLPRSCSIRDTESTHLFNQVFLL